MKICIGPYLQTVTRDRVTVVWHTAEPAASRVEYQPCERLGHSAYEQPPPPVYPQKLEDKRPKTVHTFTIEGLECEWTYFYRVVAVFADGAVEKSAGAMFRTAPALGSPFRFVTYGDCLREPEAHHRNAELARGLRPDFCLATGDMAQDVIETFPHRFFSPAAGLLRYSPWYTTMGNHDSPNEGFFRYFRFPTPHYWYSFNYGCAHFTVLNTCMDYRPGSEQWHWLEHDLQRFHAARWKFVVFHHPPYCSSDCEIARTRILDRLFDQYRVDFVLTAHATRYERSHPLSGGRYDSAGTVYLVTGGGGYDMSLPCSQHWPHIHASAAQVKTANHIVMTSVNPDQVSIQAIDEFGRLFDLAVYNKEPAALTDLPEPAPLLERTTGETATTIIAGLPEGTVNWLLPAPQFTIDDQIKVTRGTESRSIRWQCEQPAPVTPAIRRALVDQDKAMKTVAGKSYRIKAMLKTEAVKGGVTLGFAWSGDMGFLGRVDSEPVTGTRNWTEVTILVPPLPDYVYWCRLQLSAVPASTGKAWFDQITLQPIN